LADALTLTTDHPHARLGRIEAIRLFKEPRPPPSGSAESPAHASRKAVCAADHVLGAAFTIEPNEGEHLIGQAFGRSVRQVGAPRHFSTMTMLAFSTCSAVTVVSTLIRRPSTTLLI
jgi:hypothetical protein